MNRCSAYPMTGSYSSSSSTKGTSGNGNQVPSYLDSKTGRSSYLRPSYSKSTYGISSGASQASKSRALPAGPGTLPNKPNVDVCRNSVRYVVHSQSERKQAQTVGCSDRKASNDSGYGSTSSMKLNCGVGSKTEDIYSNNRHTNLVSSGRKSKSLTNLHYDTTTKHETSDRYDACINGCISSKYQSIARYSDHGQMKASCKSYTTDSVPSSSRLRVDAKGSYSSDMKDFRSRARIDKESFVISTAVTSVDRGNFRQKEMIAAPTELKVSGRSSSTSSCSTPEESDVQQGIEDLSGQIINLSLMQPPKDDKQTSLPSNWASMADGEEFMRVELSPKSQEFHDVEKLFRLTVPQHKTTLVRIERVQNPFMWEKFTRKKDKLQTKCKGTILEKKLFHGTNPALVDNICKENFDWRLCGTHGAKYGQGSYFALNASYSDNYSKSAGHDCSQFMFLANVLVGSYVKGDSTMRRPPPKNPSDPQSDLFDSTVDNQQNPSIFVVYDIDQCYPSYVIHYLRQ